MRKSTENMSFGVLKIEFAEALLRAGMRKEKLEEIINDEKFAAQVAAHVNGGKKASAERLVVLTMGGSQPDSEDAPW